MKKKQLKITLIKSKFGRTGGHAACLIGLGLRRIRHSVLREDTPAVRGLIKKVGYLLNVEEVS